MAVLPESLNRDSKELKDQINKVQDYIDYIRERLEYDSGKKLGQMNDTNTSVKNISSRVQWINGTQADTGLSFTKDGKGAAFFGDAEEDGLKVNGNFFADNFYPIGSIYMSVVSTNPTDIFGGEWQQIKDTFLLACGSAYKAGATGGSATHTPSGTVSGHTLTTSEIPSHTHGAKGNSGNNFYAYSWADGASGGDVSKTTSAKNMAMSTGSDIGYIMYSWSNSHTHNSVGGDKSHSHGFTGTAQDTMPPYTAVYVWVRTA